ncbi:tetratricopeptide repeat protein [Candidatus Avelusimicrobium stercoris]|uniref:tetratricopeptide repeat protein n=1 Tax=Candidatus Avelusimicrobium stercoris TaxID=1947924 RepID=UPI003D12F95D
MRKLLLILSAALIAAPVLQAADMSAALDFYKKQALTISADPGREGRAFAKALADNLGTWALQNPGQAATADALLLQTRLYLRAEDNADALVTLLKLRKVFPSADTSALKALLPQAAEAVQSDSRNLVSQLFALPLPSEADTEADREAEALYALSKLPGRTVYAPAAQAFETFFAFHPKYEDGDKVELWYGDLHRVNGNYLAAISQYKKAGELYPKTPYKAASLRLIGDIYADNLKDTANATAYYTRVLREFPGSSETGVVYKHMAILDENNKQFDSALINYDKSIELLGNTAASYESYRGKADVYVKNKNYGEAYNTLLKTANVFGSDEEKCTFSLLEAANVAKKRMRDQAKYMQALEKALVAHPAGPRAPQIMFDLASAYEQQGKKTQAVEMYKRLIINHPTNKLAARAQGRLDRLQK